MDSVSVENLFRLRLVVARFGEMDLARWWDTHGMLGKTGRVAASRGLPKTQWFARARAVFAVAGTRCREVYAPPGGVTLWALPAEIESAFDERWPSWIEDQRAWRDVSDSLETLGGEDVLTGFAAIAPLATATLEAAKRMRRAADMKAVPLGEVASITDEVIEQLAAGFSRGERGNLAVPYVTIRGTV